MRHARHQRTALTQVRLLALVVALLWLLALQLAYPQAGFAKDVDAIGTVDCGIPSGKRCSLGDTLVLLTDSVTGKNERITIDIRWIANKLPALDQDDEITLSVQLLPDGKLRALSVISAKKRDGTVNQGHSTDTRDVYESRRERSEAQEKDDDGNANTGAIQPALFGLGGTVVNGLTGAPVAGATVLFNGVRVTSDGSGVFTFPGTVQPGTYQIETTAASFFPRTQPVTVVAAQATSVTVVLQPQPGQVSGTVRSVKNGAPIAGATVSLAGQTATADAAGAFLLTNLPPGAFLATASASGFITQTLPVTVSSAASAQVSFLLATAYPNLTFTVVWGDRPPDLDAHLSGPGTASPPRFHAHVLNQNPEAYVTHANDDQDGFGPEHIVVRRVSGQFVPGDYHFWIDNPNVQFVGGYAGSQARVIVNRDDVLIGVFDVSAATGDPNARLWHVVNVQIDGAGNATAVPVQQFTNGDNFVVLSPPYGTKPLRR